MLFEELVRQTLRRIDLIEPWPMPDHSSSKVGRSLLAGGMVLHFDSLALVCTSPLRYRRGQNGARIGDVDLGYRLTLVAREDADLCFPPCVARTTIAPADWFAGLGSVQPLLLLVILEECAGAWVLTWRFVNDALLQLGYRPDLDGCIELAPVGHRFTLGRIAVKSPADAFGWLHPASAYSFVLDGYCWRSAHPRDWPWPLRKALQSQPAGVRYREVMRRALLARFQQHDNLRRRLRMLCYAVNVADVPAGLIEELAWQLRQKSEA